MKLRSLKVIRDIAIGFSVLVVVTIGLGVFYIWYSGQQSPDIAGAAVAEEEQAYEYSQPNLTPRKPGPDTPMSAAVQSITSPVAPGENATLMIRTLPDAICTIEVSYNKIPSKDSGLIEKKADIYGLISWSWSVDETAPEGTWPAKATCLLGEDRSAVVEGNLVVKAK